MLRQPCLPPARSQNRLIRLVRAIAIGNAILAEDHFISGSRGRWVLPHELSHTRQHAWLGPLYLPVHLVLQVISVAASIVRPLANPVPIAAHERDRIWEAFGV